MKDLENSLNTSSASIPRNQTQVPLQLASQKHHQETALELSSLVMKPASQLTPNQAQSLYGPPYKQLEAFKSGKKTQLSAYEKTIIVTTTGHRNYSKNATTIQRAVIKPKDKKAIYGTFLHGWLHPDFFSHLPNPKFLIDRNLLERMGDVYPLIDWPGATFSFGSSTLEGNIKSIPSYQQLLSQEGMLLATQQKAIASLKHAKHCSVLKDPSGHHPDWAAKCEESAVELWKSVDLISKNLDFLINISLSPGSKKQDLKIETYRQECGMYNASDCHFFRFIADAILDAKQSIIKKNRTTVNLHYQHAKGFLKLRDFEKLNLVADTEGWAGLLYNCASDISAITALDFIELIPDPQPREVAFISEDYNLALIWSLYSEARHQPSKVKKDGVS